MDDVSAYIRALFNKTRELLTGGLIALYLVIQPYTSLPSPPRKIFWGLVAVAWSVASFRVWREERRERIQSTSALGALRQGALNAELYREDPRIALYVRWPDDDPRRGPMKLFARNQGRFLLRSLQLKTLNIGFHSVAFDGVAVLPPDENLEITYRIPDAGAQQKFDLLDLIMVDKSSTLKPVAYRLTADVQKENGQRSILSYSLSYAPMQNPRRIASASDFDCLITFEQM